MKVLVAYDGSTSADAAIVELQRVGLPSQAEARVVCVGDDGLTLAEDADVREADSDSSWRLRLAGAEAACRKGQPADRLLLSAMDGFLRGVVGFAGKDPSGHQRLVAPGLDRRRFSWAFTRRAFVFGQRFVGTDP